MVAAAFVTADAPARNRGLDVNRVYSLTSPANSFQLVLSQRDPRSLSPVGRALHLYGLKDSLHTARAFSRDGSQLVVATDDPSNANQSVLTFVDLKQMRVAGHMVLNDQPGKLIWIGAKRLLDFVAGRTSGGTAHTRLHIIDVEKRTVVRTVEASQLKSLEANNQYALALATPSGGDTSSIVRFDRNGNIRVKDTGILAGSEIVRDRGVAYDVVRDPGLAIGNDARYAYVIGPGQAVVRINIGSMAISRYWPRPSLPRVSKAESSSITPLAAGRRFLAVTGGATTFPLGGKAPTLRSFGLSLMDTTTWKVRLLDRSTDSKPLTAGQVVVLLEYGDAVGFNLNGTRRFIVHDRRLDPSGVAFGAGRYVYFQTDNVQMTRQGSPALAIDVTSGRVVGRTTLDHSDLVWLDAPKN